MMMIIKKKKIYNFIIRNISLLLLMLTMPVYSTLRTNDYVIEFPTEFYIEELAVTIEGSPLIIYIKEAELNGVYYSISFVDLPGNSLTNSTVEELLTTAQEGSIQKVNGELLADFNITFKEFSGKKYDVRLSNGNVIRNYSYLVNLRLYQIMVIANNMQQLNTHNVIKFFDSFKIK